MRDENTSRYWIIDYSIKFLSDLHIGAGITLLGGNQHGLQLDANGFPFLPYTEARGLLRLGGFSLQMWDSSLTDRFFKNFGKSDKSGQGGFWSFTSARFTSAALRNLLTEQSHIKQGEDRLFSYQKAGNRDQGNEIWHGKIFSLSPVTDTDAAFMICAMRVEDRIGHRRTRGYGKVCWKLDTVRSYKAGEQPVKSDRTISQWLRLGLKTEEDRP